MRPGFSGLKSKGNGVTPRRCWIGGDTQGSTLALPASWAEVGGANGGGSAFAESWLKYEIWPWGPNCGTDSRGLSPKATGLHLEGVGGDTLGSTLALPASWAEVGGANGGASAFACSWLKYKIWHWGPKCCTDSRSLSPKATGLHLEGVGGDTLGSTLALPASWAEVGARTVEPRHLPSLKIRNLALGSQVRHGFSGLKSEGNGLHLEGVGLEGTPWGAHWHFPLVGPRLGARTVEARHLPSLD